MRRSWAPRVTWLLSAIGAEIVVQQSTAQFGSVAARLDGHHFTAQVVLDRELFRVGSAVSAEDGVVVATIDTLLKQKAATLVSRASERDLYDLLWLFQQRPTIDLAQLVELGREIDPGVSAENIMLVLVGTTLRGDACGFALNEPPRQALGRILRLKAEILAGLDRIARKEPAPPIGSLVRALK